MSLVEARWRWEILRLLANRLGVVRLEDWCWEHGELALDAYCARALAERDADAFLGVEHGALASLRAAKDAGRIAIVAFLSPHWRTRTAWVDAEYARSPELRTPGAAAVDALSGARDDRRDAEIVAADWVVTNSTFTTESLVDAGFDRNKMITVSLGGPEPIAKADLRGAAGRGVQYLYVGPVSVRKGAHYLLRSWRKVAGAGCQLHFYGAQMLPHAVIDEAKQAPGGDNIFFHGSVPAADLPAVYTSASVLVFPTLCDGFGLVVSEAMACGLPVITTRNAGAADWVDHGRSGLIIPAADQDALTAALQWCSDHPQDLFAMRGAALATASRYTWADYRRAFRDKLDGAILGRAAAGVGHGEIRAAR